VEINGHGDASSTVLEGQDRGSGANSSVSGHFRRFRDFVQAAGRRHFERIRPPHIDRVELLPTR
jgi:hypothetical protein